MTAQLAVHGRLGDAPKAITTSSGRAMATASLAVSIEEHGNADPPPLWLNVIAFARLAEELLRHHKGDLLSVAGKLQRKRWVGQDGQERERWEVVADVIISARTVRPGGGRKRENERSGPVEARHAVRVQAPDSEAHQRQEAVPFDDEIPFG